jgi:two-component system NtrC family sensor kinase
MKPEQAPAPAQEELQALREEVETARRKLADAHKMASLGRLSAGIVHEINTPIGSIFSNNEVILRSVEALKKLLQEAQSKGAPPPPKALAILETLESLAGVDKIACERISSVIRSLKTFARVSESDLRQVDLHAVLLNTIKLTGCVFRRNIRVVTEFGEIPEIEGYPGLLNQVFLNLVVNASQAIEGEGVITIRTRRDGDFVHVSIADTGHGIKPEDRSKIFSAGFSTKPIGEGTGLGLTITREIVVDTHGGTLDFESEVGVGTTFHVRLPIVQPRSK